MFSHMTWKAPTHIGQADKQAEAQAVDPLNSVTCPSSLGEPLVSLRQVNDTIHS